MQIGTIAAQPAPIALFLVASKAYEEAMAKRSWTSGLLGEALALGAALFDRRTPWIAKLLAGLVLAYLISPIDFAPDFLPILGWADDAALVPLGLWLASRFIPADVLHHARQRFSRRNINAK